MKTLLHAFLRHDPGICHDVRHWCETHAQGELVTVLQPARRITRQLPRTAEAEVDEAFHRDLIFDTNERFVGRIQKARIVGNDGFVRLPDGRFAYDYLTAHLPFVTDHPSYFQRWQRGVRRKYLRGSYFSLLGVFCRTYYHWMHDVLAQLHKVLEWLPASTQILVPAELNGMQLQLLEAMGISSNRICLYHPKERVTVEELYFIPPPTITRFDDPEVAQWLSARLRTCVVERVAVTGQQPSRLYISRAKAACRRVVNEEEVLALLRPLGFEVIHAEDLSLAQQARCFAQAEVVVAPHGAGLTNLYFSRPGTKVIEILFEPVKFRTCYWSLCEALGMDYIYTMGNAVENKSGLETDIQLSSHKLTSALRMTGITG